MSPDMLSPYGWRPAALRKIKSALLFRRSARRNAASASARRRRWRRAAAVGIPARVGDADMRNHTTEPQQRTDAATGGGTARRYRPKGLVSRRRLTVD
jgi:hypothetical protein